MPAEVRAEDFRVAARPAVGVFHRAELKIVAQWLGKVAVMPPAPAQSGMPVVVVSPVQQDLLEARNQPVAHSQRVVPDQPVAPNLPEGRPDPRR
ncbi:MAG: hypothetical protein IPK95_02145 [Cellvibrionales bacterium]|nr:hypothetical protein [Cellvibrionales bacterium]